MHRPFWIKFIFFLCVLNFIAGVLGIASPLILKFALKETGTRFEQLKDQIVVMDPAHMPPDLQLTKDPNFQKSLDILDSPFFIARAIISFFIGLVYLTGGICLRRMEMRGVYILKIISIFDIIYGLLISFIIKIMFMGIALEDIGMNILNWSSSEIFSIIFGATWYHAIFLLIIFLGNKSQLDSEV